MKKLIKKQKTKFKKYIKKNTSRILSLATPLFLGIVAITFATTIGTNISTQDMSILGNATTTGNLSILGNASTTGSFTLQGLATLLNGLSIKGNMTINDFSTTNSATRRIIMGQIVQNGAFFHTDSWTLPTGWSITAGAYKATKTAGNTNALSQSIPIIAGQTYNVVYAVAPSAGSITVSLGGTNGATITSEGAYGEMIVAGSSNSEIRFTPTSDFAGYVWGVFVYPKEFKGLTLAGAAADSTSSGGGMGILEIYNSRINGHTSFANNSLYLENSIRQTTGSSPVTATNLYTQTRFTPKSGSFSYSGSIENTFHSIVFESQGTAHTIPEITAQYNSIGEGYYNKANFTINNMTLMKLSGGRHGTSPDATGLFNISGALRGLYINNMEFDGTIANQASLWAEKQVGGAGTVNKYGIVLDGDGAGADLALGASQEVRTYSNSGKLMTNVNGSVTGGVNLTASQSKTAIGLISMIFNPYMAIAWLTPATTEIDPIKGYQFTYNGISASDVILKGDILILNGGAGKYLERADSGSTFSFLDGSGNGFSIEGWIEVSPGSTTQDIISKFNNEASEQKEWQLSLNSTEKLMFWMYDQTNSTQCIMTTTNVLSTGWHNVAMVYGGSGGETAYNDVIFYVDGVVDPTVNALCTGYVQMRDTTAKVRVGANINGALPFLGDIGQIVITDDELTADQVLKVYNATKTFYGL